MYFACFVYVYHTKYASSFSTNEGVAYSVILQEIELLESSCKRIIKDFCPWPGFESLGSKRKVWMLLNELRWSHRTKRSFVSLHKYLLHHYMAFPFLEISFSGNEPASSITEQHTNEKAAYFVKLTRNWFAGTKLWKLNKHFGFWPRLEPSNDKHKVCTLSINWTMMITNAQ